MSLHAQLQHTLGRQPITLSARIVKGFTVPDFTCLRLEREGGSENEAIEALLSGTLAQQAEAIEQMTRTLEEYAAQLRRADQHPAARLTGGTIPRHQAGSYPNLSCCGGPVNLTPYTIDLDEAANAPEQPSVRVVLR